MTIEKFETIRTGTTYETSTLLTAIRRLKDNKLIESVDVNGEKGYKAV